MRTRPYPQRQSWVSSRDSGFTLLEALVVLSILVLVAASLVSGLRAPRGGLVLQTTALELAASLRAARLEALRSKTETELSFDVEGRRYWAGKGRPRALDSRLGATASQSRSSSSPLD